ncbi:HET-domain-containing protein [Lojkania enalia]|uniref:HET-domain-containing protein n=1 Tax=Lojkania enalia TaxID=147567 RepID=A0A9P4KEX4_9PLEO|nr:HET-domain-containing protein [Didymosphaeria enalia]
MGLAKRHVVATQERPNLTTTRYGTILYEAPEAVTAVRGLSRLYDIWSMGCITLEFIIWILYGNDELNNFYDQMKGGNDQFHRTVTDWMDHIQKDPECSQDSAIRDLLYIVRTKLLVVPLPPRRQSTMGMGPSLAPPAPGESDWEYLVDEPFADKVLKKIGYRALAPRSSVPAKLCRDCNGRVFWKGGFTIEDTKENFRTRAYDCQFCEILYDICMKPDAPRGPKVLIERHQSVLKLNSGSPLPILSIVRSNSLKPPIAIQLGFPELPEPGTDVFFHIINEWLNDCDHNTNHKDCKGFHQTRLPTRLIDVGTKDSQILRLIETHEDPIETKEYIALSHPWGDPEKHPPFRTLPKDEVNGRTVENFKKAIPYNELPATFQDAIITTRAIGMRYLWIDCICIIQGPDGDFKQEAERMEDVYSGAYCVLAASRATGVRDGFLGKRAQRKYLTFKRGDEEPFYMCEPIDNFSHDVLEGSVMNRRGWILQERALARRTVFFARNQTYFECGNGVRCETLAQLHNNLADFLGDPKFPEKSIRQNRGRKIVYFQDLYKQYSRLEFKEIEDRPIAIAGLENRLRTAYKTGGKFGIFDDGPGGGLFHRSLLWVRGEEECDDKTLSPIEFSEHRNIRVPTWSWMAYKGGIDYLEPPFKTTDWAGAEVQPAWSSAKDSTSDRTNMDAEIALVATVRNYNVAGRKSDDPFKLVYDTDRTGSDGQQPQCVIVAKPKDGITEREKTYYVLIVTLTSSTDKGKIYRRLGAGYMHAKFIIGLNAPGTEGLIC